MYTSTRKNTFTLVTLQSFSISGVISAEKMRGSTVTIKITISEKRRIAKLWKKWNHSRGNCNFYDWERNHAWTDTRKLRGLHQTHCRLVFQTDIRTFFSVRTVEPPGFFLLFATYIYTLKKNNDRKAQEMLQWRRNIDRTTLMREEGKKAWN